MLIQNIPVDVPKNVPAIVLKYTMQDCLSVEDNDRIFGASNARELINASCNCERIKPKKTILKNMHRNTKRKRYYI